MSWLTQLPHQIPFRAASTGRIINDKTIEGSFLCTANDTAPPQIMLAEAMAQLAGGLVFREAHGLLTGIDHCEIDHCRRARAPEATAGDTERRTCSPVAKSSLGAP